MWKNVVTLMQCDISTVTSCKFDPFGANVTFKIYLVINGNYTSYFKIHIIFSCKKIYLT